MASIGNAAGIPPGTGLLERERIIAQPGFNRWLVPPAALAIHLCIGMAYGFSVFWIPLSRSIGISKSNACPADMSLITELFAEANSYYIDLATLIGDGVDKPIGVVGATATLTTGPNAGARTTAGTVAYADLAWLKSKLLPRSLKTAFWIFNQTVMPKLYGLQDGSGRSIWLPNVPGSSGGGVAFAANERLLGLPIVFTEKTPVVGTAGDVLLVDPLGYMIGDRMGLEIAASPHVNFLNNEMTYRFISRVAGQPMLDKPFTMIDGTNQLSHFVALN